jgi:hypothetical protein
MTQPVNVLRIITDFLSESELNKVPELHLPRIFDEPLIESPMPKIHCLLNLRNLRLFVPDT